MSVNDKLSAEKRPGEASIDFPWVGVDEEERRLKVVGAASGDGDLDVVMLGFADPSWRVRKAALDVSGRFFASPRLLPLLVDSLRSDDNAGLRNAAAEALRRIGEPAIVELQRAAQSEDPDWQKFAIDVLGEIGSPLSLNALVKAMEDADPNVRAAAAEALGKIGTPAASEVLWQHAQKSDDILVRVSALDALCRIQPALPFEALSELARERLLARSVMTLFSFCTDDRAIVVLCEALVSRPKSARQAALASLMRRMRVGGDSRQKIKAALKARADQVVEPLSELLNATDQDVSRAAVTALGMIGDPRVVRDLIEVSVHERLDEAVRQAIREMGPLAQRELAANLGGFSDGAREVAAEILVEQGDEAALAMLLDELSGQDPQIADLASSVLARVGGVEAGLRLIDRCASSVDDAGTNALLSVMERHGAKLREHLVSTMSGLHPVPLSLVLALQSVAIEGDFAMIRDLLRDPRAEIRAAALGALSRLPNSMTEDVLLTCASDESARVRDSVARNLRSLSTPRALSALLVLVQDDKDDVARSAATTLGGFSDPAAVQCLLHLCESPRVPLVLAALSSLARVSPKDATGLLPVLLAHSDKEVVKEAIRVLMPLAPLDALSRFEFVLSAPEWDVRFAAAEALSRFAAGRDALTRRVAEESDELVRARIRELLASEKNETR